MSCLFSKNFAGLIRISKLSRHAGFLYLHASSTTTRLLDAWAAELQGNKGGSRSDIQVPMLRNTSLQILPIQNARMRIFDFYPSGKFATQ